jgi:hypothetical protein
MRPRFAVHTALGTALALALTLTSVVAPAFAATSTPRPDIISSEPIESPGNAPKPRPDIIPSEPLQSPGNPPEQESPTVVFQPDVRVNYLSKSTGSGGKVTYRFRVQNVGIGTAVNVGLDKSARQLSSDGSAATYQTWSGGAIASLVQDQSQEVTVVCTPLAGYRCDGGTLKAQVSNDLDPANNAAHS